MIGIAFQLPALTSSFEVSLPPYWRGMNFDGNDIVQRRLIKPADDNSVTILGTTVSAVNIQWEGLGGESLVETGHPVGFETTRQRHHYALAFWADVVQIEVCTKPPVRRCRQCRGKPRRCRHCTGYEVLSTMFPTTIDEVRAALRDILNDR